jgi:hypothetical protein
LQQLSLATETQRQLALLPHYYYYYY